jgi:protein-L-isoaspartate(D-aspartate) O-methyltransferase
MTINQRTAATHGETEARQLRANLTQWLREHGHIISDRVEQAFLTVPRHLFVPDTPLIDAYANQTIYTKHNASGAISAAS